MPTLRDFRSAAQVRELVSRANLGSKVCSSLSVQDAHAVCPLFAIFEAWDANLRLSLRNRPQQSCQQRHGDSQRYLNESMKRDAGW